jgi:hypothetical protein
MSLAASPQPLAPRDSEQQAIAQEMMQLSSGNNMQSSPAIDFEEVKELMVPLEDSDSEMLQEFACISCQKRFDNEIMFALTYHCGHSACPAKLVSDGRPCPMCRAPLRIASVDEIQKSICIYKHIDRVAKRKRNPKNLACTAHPEERATYFCKDDKVFVCIECHFKEHRRHNVEMADTLYLRQILIDAQKQKDLMKRREPKI